MGWLARRRARRARGEARLAELHQAYVAKLEAGDEDALEAARDYGDNDSARWKAQVATGVVWLYFLVLMGSVGLLIALFTWIQSMTG